MTDTITLAALNWLGSRDTGLSSKAICLHMLGAESDGDYPSDPADLGRCLRLLEKFPEWRPRIKEMARYGTGWIGLVERWDEIAQMMADEVGIHWEKGNSAPRTFEAMQKAEADGFRRDPEWECEFSKEGHLRWAARKQAATANE